MIPDLNGREQAVPAFRWKGHDAEWLALVGLHSGSSDVSPSQDELRYRCFLSVPPSMNFGAGDVTDMLM